MMSSVCSDAGDIPRGRDETAANRGVAAEDSVLGDFADATFEQHGVRSKFFRRGGEYWVSTDGPDGTLQDFKVRHTFGVRPLQQYLVEFERGRLQALSIAWNTLERKWFSLYPDERIDASEIGLGRVAHDGDGHPDVEVPDLRALRPRLRLQALGLPGEAIRVVVLRVEPPHRRAGEMCDDLLRLVGRLLVVEPDRLPVDALVHGTRARLVPAELPAAEPGMVPRLDDGPDGRGDVVVRPCGRRGPEDQAREGEGEQTRDRQMQAGDVARQTQR